MEWQSRDITVQKLGPCVLSWRVTGDGLWWFKVKHGFVTVVGEASYDNTEALDSALHSLRKRFKSVLS